MVIWKKIRIKPLALTTPRNKLQTFIFLGVVLSLLTLSITSLSIIHADKSLQKGILGKSSAKPKTIRKKIIAESKIQTPISKPTITPSQTPTPTIKLKPTATAIPTKSPTPTSSKQYTAEKIGDTTYKINHTSNDNSMASAQDIYNALNSYRGAQSRSNLSWDNNLALLAQDRVNSFASNNGLDSHAGFRSFMDNDGFSKAGFNGLGENSAQLGGNMNGERIIKEIFGADAAHDGNQLDPSWTHVGVGVNGFYVNVNFGKNKR